MPRVLGPETVAPLHRRRGGKPVLCGVEIPQPAQEGWGWDAGSGGHFPVGISGSRPPGGQAGQARGFNTEQACFRSATGRSPDAVGTPARPGSLSRLLHLSSLFLGVRRSWSHGGSHLPSRGLFWSPLDPFQPHLSSGPCLLFPSPLLVPGAPMAVPGPLSTDFQMTSQGLRWGAWRLRPGEKPRCFSPSSRL